MHHLWIRLQFLLCNQKLHFKVGINKKKIYWYYKVSHSFHLKDEKCSFSLLNKYRNKETKNCTHSQMIFWFRGLYSSSSEGWKHLLDERRINQVHGISSTLSLDQQVGFSRVAFIFIFFGLQLKLRFTETTEERYSRAHTQNLYYYPKSHFFFSYPYKFKQTQISNLMQH